MLIPHHRQTPLVEGRICWLPAPPAPPPASSACPPPPGASCPSPQPPASAAPPQPSVSPDADMLAMFDDVEPN